MDLRSLLAVAKRWAWMVVAGTILAGGAAYAVSTLRAAPPVYEAEASLLVGPALSAANANSAQMDVARRLSLVYVEVAQSRPLLDRVSEELELNVPGAALQGQVTVETSLEPPIITIATSASEPEVAAEIANEVARQLIAAVPSLDNDEQQAQRFIERQIDALQQEIETLIAEVEPLAAKPTRTQAEEQRLSELQSRLASLRATYASLVTASSSASSNQLAIIEAAVPNPSALPAGRLQTVLFASLVGFVLATCLAFLAERLDDKIRSSNDVERIYQLPNLGVIARLSASERASAGKPPAALAAQSPAGEAFRSLRSNIEFSAPAPPRTILVTSANRAEGRTTVATHLAIAFAQLGRRVLLVEADLRQPSLARLFDLPQSEGLSELIESSELPARDVIQQTAVPGLRILAAGKVLENPAELIGSARMRELIAQLGQDDDVVMIDSPAILSASEAGVLAAIADATLVVVGAGRTSSESLREARDALALARASVIGSVFNRVPAGASHQADARETTPIGVPARSLQEDQSGS